MASPNLKKYVNSVKRSIPDGMRVDKESVALISLIIDEINNNFVGVISSKTRDAACLTAEKVRDSIKSAIPSDLRTCAFAAASNEVALYNSGFVDYKPPKPPKIGVLDKRMFKKGLEEVAAASLKQCALSKDCNALSSIMQKLAVRLAERSTEAMQINAGRSLNSLRDVLKKELGPDLFVHAQGHAEQNLEWYEADQLDFSLKLLHDEKYKEIEENSIFVTGVKKHAKSNFDAVLEKDASKSINKTLSGVLSKILENSDQQIDPGVAATVTISKNTIHQAVSNLLPGALLKHTFVKAQSDVMIYALGNFKYKYKKPPQQVFLMHIEEKTKADTDEPTIVNYRPGIKRLMQMFEDCTAGKGFLPTLDEMLNDICYAFAEKCSEAAQDENGLLTEEDVLQSINELLPEQLKRHALARIAHLQMQSGLRSTARRVRRLPRPSIAFESRRDSLVPGTEPMGSGWSGTSTDGDVSTEVKDVAFTGASNAHPFAVKTENIFSALTSVGRPMRIEQPRATERKADHSIMKATGMEPWNLREFSGINSVASGTTQGLEMRESRQESEAEGKTKQFQHGWSKNEKGGPS